jgi:putative transposase
VLDVWSRRVIGWAMATHLRTSLVVAALDMAITQRRPQGVIHHSDQGCQLGFKGPSQRVCASVSLDDFEVLLQASSSRVSSVADC